MHPRFQKNYLSITAKFSTTLRGALGTISKFFVYIILDEAPLCCLDFML
jgi:hypothetical protein